MEETLRTFWEAMCDELSSAHQLLTASDSPFSRRTLVRTSFAAVEGITFFMKSYALSKAETGAFSAAELALLREESFGLSGQGKVLVQQRFLPIESNIRFAFATYSRALGARDELDCSGRHWQAFQTAVAVRNRIVHPKTSEDFQVSDEELAATTTATNWLIGSMLTVTIRMVDERDVELKRLRERVAETLPKSQATKD